MKIIKNTSLLKTNIGKQNIPIKPFDYFLDENNWIHIIKAIINQQIVISKPLYSPNLKKFKTSIKFSQPLPSGEPFLFADTHDYLVSVNKIKKWFKPRFMSLKLSQIPMYRLDIRHLLETIHKEGSNAYLFGSRFLDISSSDSDWDILIDSEVDFNNIISKAIDSSNCLLRYFSAEECFQRAIRYGTKSGPLSVMTLKQLLQKTTVYLKSSYGEIGVFHGNLANTNISLEKICVCKQYTIRGTLKYNKGLSHCMPRLLRLIGDNEEEIYILTIIWCLGGAELAEGLQVIIRGAYKIVDYENYYWLGGPSASFEIVG